MGDPSDWGQLGREIEIKKREQRKLSNKFGLIKNRALDTTLLQITQHALH